MVSIYAKRKFLERQENSDYIFSTIKLFSADDISKTNHWIEIFYNIVNTELAGGN